MACRVRHSLQGMAVPGDAMRIGSAGRRKCCSCSSAFVVPVARRQRWSLEAEIGCHAELKWRALQAAMAAIAERVPPLQQEAVAAAASTWLASVAAILQVTMVPPHTLSCNIFFGC